VFVQLVYESLLLSAFRFYDTVDREGYDGVGCVAALPIGSNNSFGIPSTGVNYCYAQVPGVIRN
jgi:hypothetical protein